MAVSFPGSGDSGRARDDFFSASLNRGVPYDPTPANIADTARATGETRALLDALVTHSVQADARERKMLRWTVAGVLLAAVAAVAAIVSVIISIVLA